jgi:hypothetical protein
VRFAVTAFVFGENFSTVSDRASTAEHDGRTLNCWSVGRKQQSARIPTANDSAEINECIGSSAVCANQKTKKCMKSK